MHNSLDRVDGPLRVGSLFSGYGGLDLAVEHVFNAENIWFSEVDKAVAGVFAHHWPDAPNLGDITTIDWHTVPPVDILCGGFPCQDVSTVGKQAGLAPDTRSGLWSHMATAIEALQPKLVVIENVRGLLSAPAVRNLPEGALDDRCNPDNATPGGDATATLREVEPDPWGLGDEPARPLRAFGAVAPNRGHLHRWGRYADAIARWEHNIGRPAPAPALLNEVKGPRPAPEFVEWLMGLEPGWVTDSAHGLTGNQQLTALGNGVLPMQAARALGVLLQAPA